MKFVDGAAGWRQLPLMLLIAHGLLWPASLQAQDASATQQAPTLESIRAPIPAGLQTVEFFSPAVQREMKFDIVLPPDYHQSERRYPVLYLLHGYMQNYTVWGRNLNAAYYARELGDLIVVMPDGGNSWFINYAVDYEEQTNRWEDHVAVDVIDYVDANFRTEAKREGRAVSGLSMGGFGALAMGLRRPHLFASIGSSSGALSHARTAAAALENGIDFGPGTPSEEQSARIAEADALISQIIDIDGFSTQTERTPKGRQFETVEQAKAYDPFTVVYQVPRNMMPHVYLDSGTSDGLIREAREFAQILMLNNIPMDYMQSAGSHTSEYWRRSIGHMMAVQNEVMQRALGNRP
jgi:S-formylglutathione hydrolase FrmB